MRYEIINDAYNYQNPIETILLNRGIEDWHGYLNINEKSINDYNLLDNIDEAIKCYLKHVRKEHNIHIIVDSDVDGYVSASMIYNYTKKISPNINISYSLHTKKQHGISSDVVIPNNCNLLIVPDAGTNDATQCKDLKDKGVDIIILDHHKQDIINPYAIIVNNQTCNYPNKNFCGAGIVYKFLRALDDELWEEYSDSMLDVVALANISDVMDIREFETRHYINVGLQSINSKLFKALIEKQSYSINNIVNINNIEFYITPLLNALIRVGSDEDKDLLFRAFIETDEVFPYKKRGETEESEEDIYTRAARLCYNAKTRQGKEITKSVEKIDEVIKKNKINNNKIMFVNVTSILGETLTGLVANKLAEKYNRPCLLLRKQIIDSGDTKEVLFGGSCRNFSNSPIVSLKDFLTSLNEFEFVQGHDNAAGVSIKGRKIEKTIEICNSKLESLDFTKIFRVDFEFNFDEIDLNFVKLVNEIRFLFGQGLSEPLVAVKGIPIDTETLSVMGKTKDTWKVYDLFTGISYIKFKVNPEKDKILSVYNKLSDEEINSGNKIGRMDVVGTVSINNYNGILTPQFIVKDYNLELADMR